MLAPQNLLRAELALGQDGLRISCLTTLSLGHKAKLVAPAGALGASNLEATKVEKRLCLSQRYAEHPVLTSQVIFSTEITQHADHLHVVDARTFEREEIVRVRPPPVAVSCPRSRPSQRISPTRPTGPRDTHGPGENSNLVGVLRALERDAVSRAVSTVDDENSPPVGNTGTTDGEVIRTINSLQSSMQSLLQQLQDVQSSSDAQDAIRILRDAARSRHGEPAILSHPHLDLPALAEPQGEGAGNLIVASPTGTRWTIRDGVRHTRRLSDMAPSEDPPDDMQVDEEGPSEDVDLDTFNCELDDDRERRQIEEEAALLVDMLDDAGDAVEGAVRPLDLAGFCYDPSGSRIYAASTRGIGEWTVAGAGTRWFNSGTQWS